MSDEHNYKEQDLKKISAFLDDNRSSLEKFLADLKITIFNVLFVLLKSDDDSLLMVFIGVTFDYIQMLNFPFHYKIQWLWKANSFLEYIFYIFNQFQINAILQIEITYGQGLAAFYFAYTMVILLLVNIAYVAYSFKINKFTYMWPLLLLRNIAQLLVTVFFLAITDVLIIVIQCTYDKDDKLVNFYFSDIVCWEGYHIIHGINSIIILLVFVFVSTGVALTYYEIRMTSGNQQARTSSLGDVVYIVNKVVLLFFFAFLHKQDEQILVWSTFVLSVPLVYVYFYKQPYYQNKLNKFYQILSSYYVWTTSLLFLQNLLFYTSFDGALIAWLIGLPFIILIVLTSPRNNNSLISHQGKFKNGPQLQNHIRYVCQLIQDQDKDRAAYMLLLGYSEKHKEVCLEEDCPLKTIGSQHESATDMKQLCQNLILVIDRLYVFGLKKFPDSTILRISYAIFLLERLQNKKKCLEQLILAEETNPSFEQQFLIFRFRKIVKENLDTTDEQSDIVKYIAYQNYLRQCEKFMQLSSRLYKVFWQELREEQPDLKILNTYGASINSAVVEVKDFYNKLQKIDNKQLQIIKVYGDFCVQILNEKQQGQRCHQRYKQLVTALYASSSEYSFHKFLKEKVSSMIVTPDGIISATNGRLNYSLGYSKDELTNKPLKMLLPNMYAEFHQFQMQKYFDRGFSYSNYVNKYNTQYAKHKNGYIMQIKNYVSLKLKKIENDDNDNKNNNFCLFSRITTIQDENHNGYLLLNIKGIIVDMSESIVLLLGLDLYMIQDLEINIDEIFPGILNMKQFQEVKGKQVKIDTFNLKRRQLLKLQETYKKGYQDDMASLNDERVFFLKEKISTNEKQLQVILRSQKISYELTQEKEEENQDEEQPLLNNDRPAQKQKKSKQVFQLKEKKKAQKPMGHMLIGYIVNISQINLTRWNDKKQDIHIEQEQDSIYDQDDQKAFQIEYLKEQLKLEQQSQTQQSQTQQQSSSSSQYTSYEEPVPRKNLGEGIQWRRLVNNRILRVVPVDEEKIIDQMDIDAQQLRIQGESVFGQYLEEDNKTQHSIEVKDHRSQLKTFKSILSKPIQAPALFWMKLFSLVWVIHVLIYGQIQYNHAFDMTQQFNHHLDIMELQSHRQIHMHRIITTMGNMLQVTPYYNLELLHAYLKQDQRKLKEIEGKLDRLQSHNTQTFINQKGQSLRLTLIKAQTQALQISQSADNHAQIMEYLQQYQGMFEFMLNENTMVFKEFLKVIENNYVTSKLLYYILQWLFTNLVLLFILYNLHIIQIENENILFLFLEIPNKYIVKLYRKCEIFIKDYVSIHTLIDQRFIQDISEDTNMNQQKDQIQQRCEQPEQEGGLKQIQKRRRIIKKFRQNTNRGRNTKLSLVIILSLILQITSIIKILYQNTLINQMYFSIPAYKDYNLVPNHYIYSINTHKQFLINKQQSQEVNVTEWKQLTQEYLQIGNTESINYFNKKLITGIDCDEMVNKIIEVHHKDLCRIANDIQQSQIKYCQTVLNQTLTLGLDNFKVISHDILNKQITQLLNGSANANELLTNNQLVEVDKVIYMFITTVVVKFNQDLKDEMTGIINNFELIQRVSFIVFSLLILLIYLLFWLPWMANINLKTNRTIAMLNMIPSQVIINNSLISNFIKELNKKMKIL